MELGRLQSQLVHDEQPVKRFLTVLLTLLTQQKVMLPAKDTGRECDARQPTLVGWADDNWLYLIPEAAHQAVCRFCRDGGTAFPLSLDRLKRDCAKDGLSECEAGRHTITVKISGRTQRVLKLNRAAAETLVGQDFPVPSPLVTRVTGFGE